MLQFGLAITGNLFQPHSSSNSLLILTKTRTDGEGRRHSVAVPLLAAPPAQAPGWLIERRARRLQQRRHSLQVPPGTAARSRSPRRQSSIRQSSRRPSRQGRSQSRPSHLLKFVFQVFISSWSRQSPPELSSFSVSFIIFCLFPLRRLDGESHYYLISHLTQIDC